MEVTHCNCRAQKISVLEANDRATFTLVINCYNILFFNFKKEHTGSLHAYSCIVIVESLIGLEMQTK